jgi:glutathione peroxidase
MNLILFVIIQLLTLSTMQKDFYNYTFESIESETIRMADFKGKKILIVNVASECGYTKQYKQLQELHEHFADQLVIIGFPCNDFGSQESGSNEEIASFCSSKFGVTFTMAAKIKIKGDDKHPIYQWLTKKDLNGKMDESVRWNFHKFLISEDGQLLDAFPSSVSPLDDKILAYLKQ